LLKELSATIIALPQLPVFSISQRGHVIPFYAFSQHPFPGADSLLPRLARQAAARETPISDYLFQKNPFGIL
jgi:hypothetical protein